jgi:hypothetical protein
MDSAAAKSSFKKLEYKTDWTNTTHVCQIGDDFSARKFKVTV